CYFLLGIVTAVLLSACTPSATTQVTVTPTAAVLADCFQSATARAWVDDNGDGVWDEGERPLPGVEFILDPSVYSRTTSDENGMAAIFATTPGDSCPQHSSVIAISFAGYTLTTPQSLDYTAPDADYVFGFRPESPATLVETEAYTGVIFDAAVAAEFIPWLVNATDGVWTPTAVEVMALEDGLAAYLQEGEWGQLVERLPDYTRQYAGFVRGDEQFIYANFFCRVEGTAWQETAVIVADGGDCYFQVVYNVDTGEFVSVSVNGES
ncbi:MAG TPA: hypothetical protein PLK31_16155, partial [Chloroflexota bacterium]|nr:hypothetical protein [Chloroflexota bacterium]